MRSTTTSRRLRSQAAHRSLIEPIAHIVDQQGLDEPGHLIVYAIVPDPKDPYGEVELATKPIEQGVHPFTELAGFTAPVEWDVFGLCAAGTAHHLDSDQPSERVRSTFLVDRRGQECSLLRRSDTVTEVPGRPIGTIPDLCRRVLALPTDPAPPSTALLWTVAWLDRLLETWSDPSQRRSLRQWRQVAALHPAVSGPDGEVVLEALEDPARLAAIGQAHTAAWPWSRLRAEPEAVPLPDGTPRREITGWMDDGFYARWALGAFPSPSTLAHDLVGLLGADVADQMVEALEGVL